MKKNATFFVVPFILIILLKYFSSDKFSDDYIDNSNADYEIINVSNVPETIDFNFHVNQFFLINVLLVMVLMISREKLI